MSALKISKGLVLGLAVLLATVAFASNKLCERDTEIPDLTRAAACLRFSGVSRL